MFEISLTTLAHGSDEADPADLRPTKSWFMVNMSCTIVSFSWTSCDWLPALLRNASNSGHASSSSRRKTMHGMPSVIGFFHDGHNFSVFLLVDVAFGGYLLMEAAACASRLDDAEGRECAGARYREVFNIPETNLLKITGTVGHVEIGILQNPMHLS